MNLILLFISLSTSLNSALILDEAREISEDQIKVEESVIAWADQVFLKHENYKFEGFIEQESEEYTIQKLRIELYTERITEIQLAYDGGTYTGSEEMYQTTIKKFEDGIIKAQEALNTVRRVDFYEIHFWSNIQTIDGITVYYEIILKMNHEFLLLEAIEKSSIGKLGENSKIAYKKKTELMRVSEK